MNEAAKMTQEELKQAVRDVGDNEIDRLERQLDTCGERIRTLESENARLREADRKSELFVKEMLIRCAESIHVANTAMMVNWESPSTPPQPEAVADFLRALAGYVAHAAASADGPGTRGGRKA